MVRLSRACIPAVHPSLGGHRSRSEAARSVGCPSPGSVASWWAWRRRVGWIRIKPQDLLLEPSPNALLTA